MGMGSGVVVRERPAPAAGAERRAAAVLIGIRAGNRIVAAGMKRLAAHQAAENQRERPRPGVTVEGLEGVDGATGVKPARRRQGGGNKAVPAANGQFQQTIDNHFTDDSGAGGAGWCGSSRASRRSISRSSSS